MWVKIVGIIVLLFAGGFGLNSVKATVDSTISGLGGAAPWVVVIVCVFLLLKFVLPYLLSDKDKANKEDWKDKSKYRNYWNYKKK